jgi:hypothetical protein
MPLQSTTCDLTLYEVTGARSRASTWTLAPDPMRLPPNSNNQQPGLPRHSAYFDIGYISNTFNFFEKQMISMADTFRGKCVPRSVNSLHTMDTGPFLDIQIFEYDVYQRATALCHIPRRELPDFVAKTIFLLRTSCTSFISQ